MRLPFHVVADVSRLTPLDILKEIRADSRPSLPFRDSLGGLKLRTLLFLFRGFAFHRRIVLAVDFKGADFGLHLLAEVAFGFVRLAELCGAVERLEGVAELAEGFVEAPVVVATLGDGEGFPGVGEGLFGLGGLAQELGAEVQRIAFLARLRRARQRGEHYHHSTVVWVVFRTSFIEVLFRDL